MQFQRNENVSGFYICPCPFRQYPPLWGRLGIGEDNGFKVAVKSTTISPESDPGQALLEPSDSRKKPQVTRTWGFFVVQRVPPTSRDNRLIVQ
jgi:hypothetical protein